MLANLFESELAKLTPEDEKRYRGIQFLGRELAKKYREQQEVLASITTMYVTTFNELSDLKKSQPGMTAQAETNPLRSHTPEPRPLRRVESRQ
jgi:hypothetical protein